MSYTVIIGEGAQEHSFESARTKFTPSTRNSWNPAGYLDSSVETYAIEGRLVGAGPDFEATTMALWKALREVALRKTPQRFRLMRGAVAEIDLKPSSVLDGPFVASFDVQPTGGAYVNHIAYSLVVTTTLQGSGQFASMPDVTNLRREIETETYDDKLVRKIWRATADGDDAENLVKSFAPSGVKPLRKTVTRRLDQKGSTAIYVYEPRRDLVLEETVQVTQRSGRPIVPVTIVPTTEEGEDALLFRGKKQPAIVTLDGSMTGPDVTILDMPGYHYDEENIDPTRSSRDDEARRVPGDRELFQIRWREVAVYADDADIPFPDHGDHAGFGDEEEPGDGSMGAA